MAFELLFTKRASRQLDALEADDGLAKRLKAVRKALGMLETNPRHPGLNTHKFESINLNRKMETTDFTESTDY